jgi:hypothetical protein
MELTHLNQLDIGELRFEKIDYIIAVCHSNPRCCVLPEELHAMVPNKILLDFDAHHDKPSNNKNYQRFLDYGFKVVEADHDEYGIIEKLFFNICNIEAHHINIVIDYSCMSKKWYSMIIDCMTKNTYLAARIHLFFSYTPKIFNKTKSKKAIDYIGPILFNRDNLRDVKPVSMIASLDNNPNSILEAVSKVKPQKILAFIPQCAHDPEYTRLVVESNKSLLDRLDSNSIINYDMDRPEDINTLLTSYCLDQRIASEVMIVPQGPKTFSMMSLLLSVRYPDVKLWEIIMREQAHCECEQTVSEPIIVKTSFVNDDDDVDD